MKVYKCTDSDWYVAEDAEQAKALVMADTGEPCEDGYPCELKDEELDALIPLSDEDERPTGDVTTIRQMLAEHIGGPGWFAGNEY